MDGLVAAVGPGEPGPEITRRKIRLRPRRGQKASEDEMKKGYLTIFLTVVAVALAACSPYSSPANSTGRLPLEETQSVIYKDLTLKMYVHVRDVQVEKKNGLLIGRVSLENRRGSDMPVEIKAKWLDAGNIEIDDSWGMRPVMLKRDEITSQEFIAPSPDAVSVRFIISRPE
jgi:uncharacterized protein YcfL